MFKQSSLIVLGLLAILGTVAALGLESNPWVKIEEYLADHTTVTLASENFHMAENFLRQEKEVTHHLKSNKKLLDALEMFISMEPLMDPAYGKKLCSQADEITARVSEGLKTTSQPLVHVRAVLAEVTKYLSHNCV